MGGVSANDGAGEEGEWGRHHSVIVVNDFTDHHNGNCSIVGGHHSEAAASTTSLSCNLRAAFTACRGRQLATMSAVCRIELPSTRPHVFDQHLGEMVDFFHHRPSSSYATTTDDDAVNVDMSPIQLVVALESADGGRVVLDGAGNRGRLVGVGSGVRLKIGNRFTFQNFHATGGGIEDSDVCSGTATAAPPLLGRIDEPVVAVVMILLFMAVVRWRVFPRRSSATTTTPTEEFEKEEWSSARGEQQQQRRPPMLGAVLAMVVAVAWAVAAVQVCFVSPQVVVANYMTVGAGENFNLASATTVSGWDVFPDSGGVFLISQGGEVTVGEDCIFTMNSANFGGAVFVELGGSIDIGGSSAFTSNGAAASGGAIFAKDSTTVVIIGDGSTFTSNAASANGGAINAESSATVAVGDGCTFTSNLGTEYGGAIHALTTTTVKIGDSCTFTGNTASIFFGGAIAGRINSQFSVGSSLAFVSNSAGGTSDQDSNGGDVFLSESDAYCCSGACPTSWDIFAYVGSAASACTGVSSPVAGCSMCACATGYWNASGIEPCDLCDGGHYGATTGLTSGTCTGLCDENRFGSASTVRINSACDGACIDGSSAGSIACPTQAPSPAPSAAPSAGPSNAPTSEPSGGPSATPSGTPSSAPSEVPSSQPTGAPSPAPSAAPSAGPSNAPTSEPSGGPLATPSGTPSSAPSEVPSAQPTGAPSATPSAVPTIATSLEPSAFPSTPPSVNPTTSSPAPSAFGSAVPATTAPSSNPSVHPSSIIEQLLAEGNVTAAIGEIHDEAIQLNSGSDTDDDGEMPVDRVALVALLEECLVGTATSAAEGDDTAEALTSIAAALQEVVGVPSEIGVSAAANSIALVDDLIWSAVNASSTTSDNLLFGESSNFTTAAIGSVSHLLATSLFSASATTGDQDEATAKGKSAATLISALETLSISQQQELHNQNSTNRFITASENVVLVSAVLVPPDDNESSVTISLADNDEEDAEASFTLPLSAIGNIAGGADGCIQTPGVVGGASGISFAPGRSPYQWQPEFQLQTRVASLSLYTCSGELVEVAGLPDEDAVMMTLVRDAAIMNVEAETETCAWWNEDTLSWNGSGCMHSSLTASSDNVACSCSHLTAFAVVHLASNDVDACAGDSSPIWQALYDGACYHGFLVAMACMWTLAMVVAFRAFFQIRKKAKKHNRSPPFSLYVNAVMIPVSILRCAYFLVLAIASSDGGGSAARCLEFPPPSSLGSRASAWAIPALHDSFLIPFWSTFVMVLCCWSEMCSGPIRHQAGFLSERARGKLFAGVAAALSVTVLFSVLIGTDIAVQGNGWKKQLALLEIGLYGILSLLTAILYLLTGRRVERILKPRLLSTGSQGSSGKSAKRSGAAEVVTRITTRVALGFTLHTFVLWSYVVTAFETAIADKAVTTMALFSVGSHVIEIVLALAMLRSVRAPAAAAWTGEATRFRRMSDAARQSVAGFFQSRFFSDALRPGESRSNSRSSSGGMRPFILTRMRKMSSGLLAVVDRQGRNDDESSTATSDLCGERPANVCSDMSGASIRESAADWAGLEMPTSRSSDFATRNPLAPPTL